MKITIISLLKTEIHLSELETKGCSGTVYSYLLLAKGLSELGHLVTILSKTNDSEYQNVKFVKIEDEVSAIAYLNKDVDADVFLGVSYSAKVFKETNNNHAIKIMWWHNTYTNSFYKFVDLVRINKIDYIYGVSNFQIAINGGFIIKESLKNKFNLLSRIDEISNPIYTTLFNNHKKTIVKSDKFILGFIGNPSKDQGFHKVLKIYSQFSERYNSSELHVFGSNSLHNGEAILNPIYKKEYLDSYIYDSNDELRTDIIFYGSLGRKDLYDEIKECNYIIGGLQGIESFSVSLAESLGLGVPVITRLKGGQTEFVKNENTGFVTIYRTGKLLESFEKALNLSDNDYNKMTLNCTNKILKYDYKLISKIWESKLNNILSKNRQPYYRTVLNLYKIIKGRIIYLSDIKK